MTIKFSPKREELMAVALEYAQLATKIEEAHLALRKKAAAGDDVIEGTKALLALHAQSLELRLRMERLTRETDERLS